MNTLWYILNERYFYIGNEINELFAPDEARSFLMRNQTFPLNFIYELDNERKLGKEDKVFWN